MLLSNLKSNVRSLKNKRLLRLVFNYYPCPISEMHFEPEGGEKGKGGGRWYGAKRRACGWWRWLVKSSCMSRNRDGPKLFFGVGSQGDEHDDEEGEAMKDSSSADAILRDSWYRLKCLFMESDRNLTVPCCVKIDLIWNGFSWTVVNLMLEFGLRRSCVEILK